MPLFGSGWSRLARGNGCCCRGSRTDGEPDAKVSTTPDGMYRRAQIKLQDSAPGEVRGWAGIENYLLNNDTDWVGDAADDIDVLLVFVSRSSLSHPLPANP